MKELKIKDFEQPIIKIKSAQISLDGKNWIKIPKKYIGKNSIGIPPNIK